MKLTNSNLKLIFQIQIVLISILSLILLCQNFTLISVFFFGNTDNSRGELVKVSITFFGGVLVLWGLYLNQRRTKALEKQTETQASQIHILVEQNKINEKGKVDERFKNAIEHLGTQNQAIILGGIHALNRIAQEVDSYRSVVFDILCCYLREETSKEKLWKEYPENIRRSIKPSIVIQTILDILFKSKENKGYIYVGLHANLTGFKCINADLTNAILTNAKLYNVHLEGSDLSNAKLDESKFTLTSFESAILRNASFKHSTITSCNLIGANLYKTDFRFVTFFSPDMRNANLNFTILSEAKLYKPLLVEAGLVHTELKGAIIHEAHLESSYIYFSCFQGSEIIESNFQGAKIFDSHFEGVCLYKTHFEGVHFKNTHFEGANSLKSEQMSKIKIQI